MLRLFRISNGLIQESIARWTRRPPWPAGSRLDRRPAPDEQERAILQRLLHTDLPESEDVEEIEASARCFVDQAGVHVPFPVSWVWPKGGTPPCLVAFILQKERLITIREESELADFRLLRLRARRGPWSRCAAARPGDCW
ncbi:MAG: hypothetical protein U5K56_05185 [Halioglobus sp.]|nr:hypothetical protein [Halioglobus sp.]